jgi:hypothetical protein
MLAPTIRTPSEHISKQHPLPIAQHHRRASHAADRILNLKAQAFNEGSNFSTIAGLALNLADRSQDRRRPAT